MMPKDTYTFLSSRIVKEVSRLGGDVRYFVPAPVEQALRSRFGHRRRSRGQSGMRQKGKGPGG